MWHPTHGSPGTSGKIAPDVRVTLAGGKDSVWYAYAHRIADRGCDDLLSRFKGEGDLKWTIRFNFTKYESKTLGELFMKILCNYPATGLIEATDCVCLARMLIDANIDPMVILEHHIKKITKQKDIDKFWYTLGLYRYAPVRFIPRPKGLPDPRLLRLDFLHENMKSLYYSVSYERSKNHPLYDVKILLHILRRIRSTRTNYLLWATTMCCAVTRRAVHSFLPDFDAVTFKVAVDSANSTVDKCELFSLSLLAKKYEFQTMIMKKMRRSLRDSIYGIQKYAKTTRDFATVGKMISIFSS